MKTETIILNGIVRNVITCIGMEIVKHYDEPPGPKVNLDAYIHRKLCEKYAKDHNVSFQVAWNKNRK